MLVYIVGFCVLVATAARLLRYLSALFVPKRSLSELGDWAVITGATDGIGKAYGKAIAETNQMNLLLVGRSKDKLDAAAKEIKTQVKHFDREIRLQVCDFAQPCEVTAMAATMTSSSVDEKENSVSTAGCVSGCTFGAEYNGLAKALEEIVVKDKSSVGLLVHSAGVSYPGPMGYEEVSPQLIANLLAVNLQSALVTSRLVYPLMKARRSGALVFLGSGAAEIDEPLLAVYAGVKAGLQTFAQSLQSEARANNVLVQCQTPLLVTSKMSKIRNTSITVPAPETYAAFGLRCIAGARLNSLFGLMNTPSTISPYPIHAALLFLLTDICPKGVCELFRLSQQKFLAKLYKRKLEKKAH